MSKAIYDIKKIAFNIELNGIRCYGDEFRNIIKELERLEAIDNAKTSEAINYLDQFLNEMTSCLENPKQYAKGYEKEIFYKYKHTLETTIKQVLLKAQEQEKVLEIIKEKEVSIFQLNCCKNVNEYNDLQFTNNKKLTQEEFELLKRYFENV